MFLPGTLLDSLPPWGHALATGARDDCNAVLVTGARGDSNGNSNGGGGPALAMDEHRDNKGNGYVQGKRGRAIAAVVAAVTVVVTTATTTMMTAATMTMTEVTIMTTAAVNTIMTAAMTMTMTATVAMAVAAATQRRRWARQRRQQST